MDKKYLITNLNAYLFLLFKHSIFSHVMKLWVFFSLSYGHLPLILFIYLFILSHLALDRIGL